MKKAIKILPIIVLCLIPLIWFYGKGDILINGIDTNFPLDPSQWFIRRFYVWNNVFNAGVDFSSSVSGIFFHLIQVIPYLLGLHLQFVEVLSLIFWFTAIILSSYVFAKVILPGRWLIQILFVSLYSFNIYLFNSWENVKVSNLSLVASIPATLAVLTKLKAGEITLERTAIYGVLIGIVLSGSGINPSYFFTFFLIIFIYFFAQLFTDRGHRSSLDFIKKTIFFLSIILLINAFWMIPTVSFIRNNISSVGSIDKLGLTNWIDSLSEHTSLLNIMRGQGAWDWYAFDGITGLPTYIPYALNYFHRLPFIIFSFLIPSLALVSFLEIDFQRKYLYLSFGLMMIFGIFLGAGTHLPSGEAYEMLINHVPFFTIFRSPWYIFTPLLLVSYAGLVSLLLYNLVKIKKYNTVVYSFALILIIGNLIYSYPLITGKIFRPNRPDSFYINFPSYIFEAKNWLDNHDYGRIITYPDDEIEQFNWGYRGIESILSLLTNREFLYSSLNALDAPISKLIKEFYKSLSRGELELATNLAIKMDVGIIFEKRDQKSLSPKIPTEMVQSLYANFGQWYFYKFPKNDFASKLTSANKVFLGYPYSSGSRLVGLLGKDELLVNPDEGGLKNIKGMSDLSNLAIQVSNSQAAEELADFNKSVSQLNNRLLTRDMSKVNFDFNIPREAVYQPSLDRYKLEDFGLGVAPGQSIEFWIDGEKETWEIEKLTDSFVYFKPLKLSQGQHKIILKIDNKSIIKGGDFEGFAEFDRKGDGIFTIESNGTGHLLNILNKGVVAPEPSADFNVLPFDPLGSYLIEVKYQHIYGNNASLVVYQDNSNTLVKAQTERLPNYPQMNTFGFFYEPVRTNSVMKVSLIAPFIKDPLGTKVLYDDLGVFKVFTNNMFFVEMDESKLLSSMKVNIRNVSPVLYEGKIEGGIAPHILVFAENYSPEWSISLYNNNGNKLDIKPIHFSGNLFANAWYVEGAPAKYTAKIYYRHQNLLLLGFLISALPILLLLAVSLWKRKEK